MTNKWILGSTISTLMGILAAAVYLVLVQPQQVGADVPHHHAEWLLWFFLAMVVVSMLVNLSVLVASPVQLLRRLVVLPFNRQSLQCQSHHYQQQVQLFLQLHQLQLKRLTSQADIYLWSTPSQPVLLQVATEAKTQGSIEEMRLLFRWMLRHQCRQGFYVSMHRPDLQAEIFANEAGIIIVDPQTLENLHQISFQ